jgi:hypothetical protein
MAPKKPTTTKHKKATHKAAAKKPAPDAAPK